MPVDHFTLFDARYPGGSQQVWVDQASGNDGNPGTSQLPKATIQAGVAALSSGGTVWVRNGTYTNVQVYGRHGGPTNWLRIVAQSGHSPKINSTGNNNTFALSNCSYAAIYGFEMSGLEGPQYE